MAISPRLALRLADEAHYEYRDQVAAPLAQSSTDLGTFPSVRQAALNKDQAPHSAATLGEHFAAAIDTMSPSDPKARLTDIGLEDVGAYLADAFVSLATRLALVEDALERLKLLEER